ncbi:L-threonine 3-dehydrogenase [Paraburkholderia aspalathi]|uniref:alcohol dehydrogenase catalytic domain-containing protein n=1 Tax=Paraburkholderia aspalathi TaxID=1324617 RepID=UPI001B025CD2|nr:alcohol dehydrogenase catalytic domain-containing protein [Paraburkholderia aspalathi]CAE6832839.1 L-threonine 3-dehydrogenase [Paraburkholderia aspalathi]
MHAAEFHGDRKISVVSVDIPVAAPGELLVRVRRTALCGSDTKLWLKGAQHTPGHEIFGVVEAKGHSLDGQRCLVYIPVHCGHCEMCRAGNTQMCLTESVLIGWNRPGGYAEYLAVPEQCLLPVPDDIDDDLAPLLLDTIGTSAHAVRFIQPLVPPAQASAVLVTGAGPVGLGAVLALQNQGYKQVWISDPKEERVAVAESFGALRHPIDDTTRRFNLIVECSGAHAARNRAIEIVLPNGAVMLVGENDNPWPLQENKAIRRKDFYMVRTFYFPKSDLGLNVELLRREKTRYRQFVDTTFGIDKLPEMYARFAAGELIKPLLAFE